MAARVLGVFAASLPLAVVAALRLVAAVALGPQAKGSAGSSECGQALDRGRLTGLKSVQLGPNRQQHSMAAQGR